jgi:uncharacterized C2H2 Zn-finger protein
MASFTKRCERCGVVWTSREAYALHYGACLESASRPH